MQAKHLKTAGYLTSTLSVLLLGAVAWASTDENDWLRAAVLIGVASSVVGMFMRWLSYQEERATGSVARRANRA